MKSNFFPGNSHNCSCSSKQAPCDVMCQGGDSITRTIRMLYKLTEKAQAGHRGELKPGNRCLTAGCRGWQPVPGDTLGRVALPRHCQCH